MDELNLDGRGTDYLELEPSVRVSGKQQHQQDKIVPGTLPPEQTIPTKGLNVRASQGLRGLQRNMPLPAGSQGHPESLITPNLDPGVLPLPHLVPIFLVNNLLNCVTSVLLVHNLNLPLDCVTSRPSTAVYFPLTI
jgi:hypothetical protein